MHPSLCQPLTFASTLRQAAEARGHRLYDRRRRKTDGQWVECCKHCGAQLVLAYKAQQSAQLLEECRPQPKEQLVHDILAADQSGHWTEARRSRKAIKRINAGKPHPAAYRRA